MTISDFPLRYTLGLSSYFEDFPNKYDVMFDLLQSEDFISGKIMSVSSVKAQLNFKIKSEDIMNIFEELTSEDFIVMEKNKIRKK